MESDEKNPYLIFLDFIYAIAELARGIVCLLTNSKAGDQKLKWNCPRNLLVCDFVATSLARVQETDINISATDNAVCPWANCHIFLVSWSVFHLN